MTGPTITLDNLFEVFLEVFPEFAEEYRLTADEYEHEEGRLGHTFLGWFMESQVLKPELGSREPVIEPSGRLIKAFGLLELLLTEGDDDVQNAAGTTVCEGVALDGDAIYERAKPYLGPVTRQTCDELIASFSAAAERHRDERRWWRRGS
ncbi:MAG: hypothetical protein M3P85_13560 [Actinomycetota bacterium]|nr:hypothetical protein [Actinomycetota bacterium]